MLKVELKTDFVRGIHKMDFWKFQNVPKKFKYWLQINFQVKNKTKQLFKFFQGCYYSTSSKKQQEQKINASHFCKCDYIIFKILPWVKSIKGLVHSKMKKSLCFTHPWGIPGLYDFLISDKSNWSFIKYCPGSSKLYHCSGWCFFNSPQDVK